MILRLLTLAAAFLLSLHAADIGSARTRIFISDLHLGVGRGQDGAWSPYEDFRWNAEFTGFLTSLSSDQGVDLVLVGDTFELWQSLEQDCRNTNADLGCTEGEARHRLARVLQQHQDTIDALGAFARSGSNHVFVIPGNHDAGLLFPAVRESVLKALAAPERVTIDTRGYWLSPDDLIYAEHGQQIGKEVNRFENWPVPFIESGGRRYLRRPWGEKFVQDIYNRYEERYPIIDNISQESVGVRYALRAEPIADTSRIIGGFVRFMLFDISRKQSSEFLGGPGGRTVWDVNAVRDKGDQALVDSVIDPVLQQAAASALAAGTLDVHITELSDDDILAMCDGRALEIREATRWKRSPALKPCPATTLGAAGQNLLRQKEDVLRQHVSATYTSLVTAGAARPFSVFVYGHTHAADRPFTLRDYPVALQIVNTGAWQRVIEPNALEERAIGVPVSQVLRAVRLEDLPPCYSFVKIPPYSAKPVPELSFWQQTKDGQWTADTRCNR